MFYPQQTRAIKYNLLWS